MAASGTTKELLVNGNFETGDSGWTASDSVLWATADAHAGLRHAWLGGYNNGVDRLSQTVAIPSGALSATLKFWLLIATQETVPGAWDGMQLSVNDTAGNNLAILKLYTNQDTTGGWIQSQDFDLTQFAGRTVELRFTAVTDSSEFTSFLLDDMTLTAALPTDPGIAMTGNRQDWSISASGSSYVVSPVNTGGGRVTLRTFEPGQRLNFADSTVALGTTGIPAQVYRLYQAAFDRKPDSAGLGYHISAIDDSGLSLSQVAQNFINSPEFASRYGSLTNQQFVNQLYLNVLHRGPDAGGLAYWTDVLNRGAGTRASVLAGFSESPENQASVGQAIVDGIVYIPLNRPTTQPPTPTCIAPKVLQNGVCVTPLPTCAAPAVLLNGQCVVPTTTCQAPKVLQNGLCVTVQVTCVAPQILQNGLCVTPPPPPPPAPTCSAGQVLQNNICVTPPPVTCPLTQVLVGGACVNRTTPRALNGNVILEEIVFGKRVYGDASTYYFASDMGQGLPSFYPRLTSNLSETVTFDVCFTGENSECSQVKDVPPNTTFKVANTQTWATGEFNVYATRQLSADPTQARVLVGTFNARQWGWVPNPRPAPDPCFIRGVIANPNCHGIIYTPPPVPVVVAPPTAPVVPVGGAGGGENASSCVTATTSGDTVTLRNGCGRKIFFMWCGEQKYTSRRCNTSSAYYTSTANSDPADYSAKVDIYMRPGAAGTLSYGACFGQVSFGHDEWRAYADGSYVCLKQ